MPAPTEARLLPRIIGHRGAALRAPENTLAGLRKAAALGCTWVEFDVRLTADDRLAMIHDSTVDRTTTSTGTVRELSMAALEQMDAGSAFSGDFQDEAIPSLEAVIGELDRLSLRANIEIKCDAGDADAAAAVLIDILNRHWPDRPLPLISSFDHRALAAVRRRSDDLPLGVLIDRMDRDWRPVFDSLSAATLHVGNRNLIQADVAGVVAEGIEIGVYTVNDPDRAHTLFSWGIASVFSDCPDIVNA